MEIELGATMRDRITGFQGVVTGRVNYLTGCNQALIAPPLGPDGSIRCAEWFDDQRLERVDAEVIRLDNSYNTGCDKSAPKR